ncbi:DUF1648 domain-containing protein [Curtobacterium pusillum]|uniref:DUF1648 domain-containing protein n=1 Tax=Curtobacterium pusillum TaxID=69373 RepID=UPI0011A4ACB6|nr:DUF1648 domain-containing protein [Curtobacterium pusillum]
MTNPTTGTGTRLAVVAPSVAVGVALAVVAIAVGPALPDRIATHFAADGRPDGWGSPWTVLWITVVVVAAAIVCGALALRFRDRRTAALLVPVVNALAASLTVVWIAVALTNASGAPTFPWWLVGVVLGAMVVVAVPPVVALIRTTPPVPAFDVAPLPVGPDARVAWRSSTGAWWFAALGIAVVGLGVLCTVLIAPESTGGAVTAGVLFGLASLSALVLARVECTVDRRGLRLTSTWTRIPLMRVPLDRIESCGWEQVSPGQWGGWGYRFSGRGVAYVVRSGPGLVARLGGGGARMVTVADAERGAAALGALLAARPTD